jgi:hypothetical protein
MAHALRLDPRDAAGASACWEYVPLSVQVQHQADAEEHFRRQGVAAPWQAFRDENVFSLKE